MACLVEGYNLNLDPQAPGKGSLIYNASTSRTNDHLQEFFIPPSALHSQSPLAADPTSILLEYPYAHQSRPETMDALHLQHPLAQPPCMVAVSESQIPQVEQSLDVADLTENLIPAWVVAQNQQQRTAAPPWWETELAADIHNTLRTREKAITAIQYRSPQLEQR